MELLLFILYALLVKPTYIFCAGLLPPYKEKTLFLILGDAKLIYNHLLFVSVKKKKTIFFYLIMFANYMGRLITRKKSLKTPEMAEPSRLRMELLIDDKLKDQEI